MNHYLSRHRGDRIAALVLTFSVFAAQWFRHATFRSTSYDLAVFEQSVWKMAHGHGATSSLLGWNIFADHLSPILLVFVPLYRLAATPLWFFGAQAFAVGLGLLCVRPLAEAVGLPERSGLTTALVAAFAVNPAVWNAALYDFHPLTLSVPILLVACTAALRNNHRVLLLMLVAMMLVRDDLTVAASAIAFVGWRADSPDGRRSRALIAGAGITWMLVGAQLGTAMGSTRFFDLRYGYLGATPLAALHDPLSAITSVARHMVSLRSLGFLVVLIVPFAMLSLGSPAWFGLALFLTLPNMASADPNLRSAAFQYGAPLMPLMLLAAAGTMRRLPEWARWRSIAVVPGFAALAFVIFGPPATQMLSSLALAPADAAAALATIRADDRVAASARLGPHLADRQVLLPLPAPFLDSDRPYLDEGVTSTSPAAQRSVNVVVLDASRDVLTAAKLDALVKDDGFVSERFGSVVVYRRLGGAPLDR